MLPAEIHCSACVVFEGFPQLGVPFWGPHNKDYSILGSILEATI